MTRISTPKYFLYSFLCIYHWKIHSICCYVTINIARSVEVSKKLNQKYTFITFDYAAAKIAFDIVWDQPSLYKDVIVHLGAFHTMCSYMGALGKNLHGSVGENDVLEHFTRCALTWERWGK
jgi:hypothetical protein